MGRSLDEDSVCQVRLFKVSFPFAFHNAYYFYSGERIVNNFFVMNTSSSGEALCICAFHCLRLVLSSVLFL